MKMKLPHASIHSSRCDIVKDRSSCLIILQRYVGYSRSKASS